MRSHLRRSAALAVGLSVAITTAIGPPAQAAEDRAPARAGTAWLSGELERGLLINEEFDFTDYGLSIDAALAFAELAESRKVNRIAKAVAADVTSYTTGADFGTSDVYAGATAKAATLAIVADRDPARFGGVDLVAQLEGLVADSGRIADRSEFGDFANVVGQSYAAWALSSASSDRAEAAVAYLLAQQCVNGSFRLDFTADAAAANQGCQGAPASERAPDTDATAIATMALGQVTSTTRVRKAVKRSTRWLVGAQRANGGFGGGTTTSRPNTNSTGLAGWALGELGFGGRAARAAAFVRRHQAVDVGRCATDLAKDAGAIGYDARAVRAAESRGITKTTSDQWRRASAQALPVLSAARAATGDLSAVGRATSKKVVLGFSGVAPGEQVCVTGPGAKEAVFGGWKSTRLAVDLPRTRAASATYRVVDADGNVAKVVVDLT